MSADTLHLKDGRAIEADDCRLDSGEWRCRRAGGQVGFPEALVLRVERSAPRRRPSAIPPAAATPPLPVSPAGDPPLSLEEARRIRESLLRKAPGAGADPEDRRTLAKACAYLGNLAMLARDYPTAEGHFREALQHDPELLTAQLNLSTALIVMDRHDAADTVLHQVLSEDPGNARALELLGESAFQTGRLEDAIETWERALAAHPDERIQQRLSKARRLLSAEEGFNRSDGAHFTLRFDGGEASPELAREILAHLEDAWSMLAGRLSYYPDGVIQVTLYSTRAFHDVTESPAWVGGLFDGQIRIPIRGLTHVTPQARRVLTHELTHAFLASRTRGSAPQWLQEGIAQVMEGRTARADRETLRQAWVALDGLSWAREFTYQKALSQVEFLIETWSEAHLNEILERVGRGTGIDAAMMSALGKDHEQFLTAWAEWLSR